MLMRPAITRIAHCNVVVTWDQQQRTPDNKQIALNSPGTRSSLNANWRMDIARWLH